MRIAAISSLTLCLGLLAIPRDARACGGTFCDSGPQSMPVDQTAESILFVLGAAEVEAHIQIQYDPNAEADQFAWLLPLTSVPEFSVGSQQLFVNLLNGSVPNYGFMSSFENCGGDDGWGDDGCDSTSGGEGGTTGDTDGTGGGTTGDAPEVVLEDTIGAFSIVVLQGGTATEVMNWLGQNGYFQDPAATPLLQDYLDEGFLFAAFKLVPGADVGEIHPIVVKYDGTEPCVPIRLTKIAAQDDMQIRTFFLGDGRVGPTNYRHVVLNQVQLDWPNFAANYNEVVSLAVDEEMANGHAFVTEYAGDSSVASTVGLYSAAWDPMPFEVINPVDVIDTLEAQGVLDCDNGACSYDHPLILGLLRSYLPAPMGIEEGEFYSCVLCYEDQIDPVAWDGAAFASDYDARIIVPGQHAESLLQSYPYLTRLFTTISPVEMTQDPFFHVNTDLPDQPNLNLVATRNVTCEGNESYDLPDGRMVGLKDPNVWAKIDDMPYAERIETIPPVGPPQVLVDNGAKIDLLVQQWNAGLAYEPPTERSCHDEGGDDSNTGGSASTGTGDVITGGDDSTDSTAGGDGANGANDGCSCRADGRSGAGLFGMLLVGAGWVRRRRGG